MKQGDLRGNLDEGPCAAENGVRDSFQKPNSLILQVALAGKSAKTLVA